MWSIKYTKQAGKDAKLLSASGLKNNAQKLLDIIKENPFKNPPPYEKLQGDLSGFLSRRINIKHRLIYKVYESDKIIKVIRMWTHYQ